ncbi:MAG: hypothetical protein M0030_11630 [Actinomycetota bacterium]|nr:hypothetical protein [Actinomycetota bacterium]
MAQLGLQRFSQKVPRPVALEAVQLLQIILSTPMPPSAQAWTMEAGRRLSLVGDVVQSATTPGSEEAGGTADGLLATGAGSEVAGAEVAGAEVAGAGVADEAGPGEADATALPEARAGALPAAELAGLPPHAVRARVSPTGTHAASVNREIRFMIPKTPGNGHRLGVMSIISHNSVAVLADPGQVPDPDRRCRGLAARAVQRRVECARM